MSRRAVTIWLVAICAVALGLRLLSLPTVFGGSFVSFIETDAYSRMYYAQEIAGMPFWDGVVYTVQNNLLFSGMVALSSAVMPIEVAGALWPPLLALATIVVVYLLTARLFNETVGLLAATFTAVIPSEFLHRTLLGFADHHALEVFLLTLTMYCIVRVWQSERLGWRWALGGSASLLAYMLNWKAGLIMLALLAAIALTLALMKRRRMAVATLAVVVVALVVYMPLGGWQYVLGFVPGASDSVASQGTQAVVSTVTSEFGTRTISELRPLLSPTGTFSMRVVQTNLHVFTLTFFLGAFMLWRHKETDRSTKVLLIGWSGFMLVATLLFRRNLYYFTINVAILSAVAVWQLAGYVKGKQAIQAAVLGAPLLIISLPMASLMGQGRQYTMSEEWHAALEWLEEQQVSGHVTAWSDYGHWIKYVSGHEPNLLPGPGGTEVAQLLLSTDADEARTLMNALDTDYLIVDTPALAQKSGALAIVAGRYPPLDRTLMARLWSQAAPQPDLTPVYQSQTIKIFKYAGGG
jgi:asparagine N-glycosylation enzyme membrane subunit Stt3